MNCIRLIIVNSQHRRRYFNTPQATWECIEQFRQDKTNHCLRSREVLRFVRVDMIEEEGVGGDWPHKGEGEAQSYQQYPAHPCKKYSEPDVWYELAT